MIVSPQGHNRTTPAHRLAMLRSLCVFGAVLISSGKDLAGGPIFSPRVIRTSRSEQSANRDVEHTEAPPRRTPANRPLATTDLEAFLQAGFEPGRDIESTEVITTAGVDERTFDENGSQSADEVLSLFPPDDVDEVAQPPRLETAREREPPRVFDVHGPVTVPPAPLPSPAQGGAMRDAPLLPFRKIEELEHEKQDRFAELGELIRDLRDHLEESRTVASQAEAAELPPVDPTFVSPVESPDDLSGSEPTSAREIDPEVSSGRSSVAPASAAPVVDQPVDRVALADSLFAVGEYGFALDAYQQVETAELNAATQLWLHYQTACCLRRMGRTADAAREYRRVTAIADAGRVAEQSRWWLSVIDSRKELTDRIGRLRAAINALEGETDEQSDN